MKFLGITLAALLLLIQYPLWFGKGGWMRVREVDQQILAQRAKNAQMRVRSQTLDAEVQDLRRGHDAIEERARSELGMIKRDEVFFQVLERGQRVPERRPAQVSAR
jgi:cell division protein FtsB